MLFQIVSAVLAILLVLAVIFWKVRPKIDGTLVIDRSDPEKDSFLFEVESLDKIPEKKFLIIKVKQK